MSNEKGLAGNWDTHPMIHLIKEQVNTSHTPTNPPQVSRRSLREGPDAQSTVLEKAFTPEKCQLMTVP